MKTFTEKQVEQLNLIYFKRIFWLFLHFAERAKDKKEIIKLWHEFEDNNKLNNLIN